MMKKQQKILIDRQTRWNNKKYYLLIIGLIALAFLAATAKSEECTEKGCFISAANDCEDLSILVTEKAGVIRYSSSNGCVFNKTLASLDASESQEMKNLLEGKSLSCEYEKGKFDQRLVTSLIFGIEQCEGELRDVLGQLILFAEPETKKPTLSQNILAVVIIALLVYSIIAVVLYMRKKRAAK